MEHLSEFFITHGETLSTTFALVCFVSFLVKFYRPTYLMLHFDFPFALLACSFLGLLPLISRMLSTPLITTSSLIAGITVILSYFHMRFLAKVT